VDVPKKIALRPVVLEEKVAPYETTHTPGCKATEKILFALLLVTDTPVTRVPA
jgi:hypothetical protein